VKPGLLNSPGERDLIAHIRARVPAAPAWLTVGIGEELSLLFLSPNYRSVVGFLTILLVLIFRPRGILGQRAY